MFWRVLYEVFVMLLVITYAILIFTDPASHPQLSEAFVQRVEGWFLVFLVGEYLVRLWRAPEKRRFLRENWFDLVAMIPFDQVFYLARFMRVIRLIRILRASPFLWSLVSSASMRWIFSIVGLIMLWSSIGIYLLEQGNNPNVDGFGDALWWSIVTTTTVGYGDISPVTTGGRIIAACLMLTGIGLLGALTANFASHWTQFFQNPAAGPKNRVEAALKETVKQQIEQVEELTEEEYQSLLRSLEAIRKGRGETS